MADGPDFEDVVARFYEPLYQFAFSLTRAEADACDLTQQTFYVWATKGHQLRDTSKVKTWLFTTLHRVFLEGRRRETRFPHFKLDDVPLELPSLSPTTVNQLDSAQVLVAQEQVDTAGPGEPFGNSGKVFTDILSRRPFVEARVLARLIDSIAAQGQ